MQKNIVQKLEFKELKMCEKKSNKWNSFNTGDLLSIVMVSSTDNKKRTNFIGLCIAKFNRSIRSTFIVRNILSNEGVEFTVPFHSPLVKSIQIINKKKTRASKLYYARKYSSIKINKL